MWSFGKTYIAKRSVEAIKVGGLFFFTKLMCFVLSVSTLLTSLRAKIPACEMIQWERAGVLASLATQRLLIVWIIAGQI